eukprot:scaffold26963_cov155-Skeletonema_dohrnii-CCMP3373.AAC.13
MKRWITDRMTAPSRPQPHLPLPSSSFAHSTAAAARFSPLEASTCCRDAFTTGFASGNAAKQAELVQMKAEASTSALYTPKSSKVPKAKSKSSKAPLGWECEMMLDMHFSDSYHGISCVIDAVTTCAGYSPPNACCCGVTMGWDVTTDIPLAAMLVPAFTEKSAVLAVQGPSLDGTIAGAITLEGIKRGYEPKTAWYNFALTKMEEETTYPTYQTTAYGVLDVEIM